MRIIITNQIICVVISAGVKMTWLINQQQQVEIYRSGKDVELQNLPTELLGEEILTGFSLKLDCY